MKKYSSAVWEVFEKTDDVDKVARCLLCSKELSFRASVTNLKSHLRQRHKVGYERMVDQENIGRLSKSETANQMVGVDSDYLSAILRNSKQKSPKNPLWKYFIYETNTTASCKFCRKKLSHRTSIYNLRTHLRFKHETIFEDYLRGLEQPGNTLNSLKEMVSPSESTEMLAVEAEDPVAGESSLQQGEDYDETELSIKFCAKVWEQFELRDSSAHCIICDKSMENTIEDMKSHLEEAHPSVLEHILNTETKAESTDAESEQNDEDAVYTDVVYLEEAKPRKSINTLKRKSPTPIKETEQEKLLSAFLNYVTLLLNTVDNKSLSKLQVDIINMIISRTETGNK